MTSRRSRMNSDKTLDLFGRPDLLVDLAVNWVPGHDKSLVLHEQADKLADGAASVFAGSGPDGRLRGDKVVETETEPREEDTSQKRAKKKGKKKAKKKGKKGKKKKKGGKKSGKNEKEREERNLENKKKENEKDDKNENEKEEDVDDEKDDENDDEKEKEEETQGESRVTDHAKADGEQPEPTWPIPSFHSQRQREEARRQYIPAPMDDGGYFPDRRGSRQSPTPYHQQWLHQVQQKPDPFFRDRQGGFGHHQLTGHWRWDHASYHYIWEWDQWVDFDPRWHY
ncbi:hypothetical protein QBC45DRAFT_445539 [Copromyces sp. CBS 386.78]|nr:hypothetical protein QBC45DRAFT_445539 [Copromyces sp. CBS 386.78]